MVAENLAFKNHTRL